MYDITLKVGGSNLFALKYSQSTKATDKYRLKFRAFGAANMPSQWDTLYVNVCT